MTSEKLAGVFYRAYATGAAAIAETLSVTGAYELRSIRVHLSAVGGAGDLTITEDNALGAEYDTNLITESMATLTDYVYNYLPGQLLMQSGDKVDFTWANANSRTWGLCVYYKLL